jgi:hypothetical protein
VEDWDIVHTFVEGNTLGPAASLVA